MEALLSSKLFQNPNLMDKILNDVDGGLMRNLHVRLISKEFNDACIRIIQKTHVKLKMEYFEDQQPTQTPPHPYEYNLWLLEQMYWFGQQDQDINDNEDFFRGAENLNDQENDFQFRGNRQAGEVQIYVNYRKIQVKEVRGYMRFLKEIGVKVERIFMKNIWKLCKSARSFIHSSIIHTYIGDEDTSITSLIGMDNLCDHCIHCTMCNKIKKNCQEFSQVTALSFIGVHTNLHFNKLIVTDYSLNQLGIHSRNSSGPWFFERLQEYIRPSITCNTLQVQIFESRFGPNYELALWGPIKVVDIGHQPIPREILEFIIEKWNVQNVTVQFVQKVDHTNFCNSTTWENCGYISKFKFTDAPESVEEKGTKPRIQKVDLDLTDSKYCASSILEKSTDGYCNTIENIQKLFSTDHISISFSHWNVSDVKIQNLLGNLFQTVFHESPNSRKSLKLDVKYFARIAQLIYDDDKLAEIPSEYVFKFRKFHVSIGRNRQIHYKKRLEEDEFINEKWVGKKIRMEDTKNHCEVNLEIFVRESEFEDQYDLDELLKINPNALIRHFY